MNCTLCNTVLPEGKIMFRDECEHCGGDLHICLNCIFYDPGAARQCREPAVPEAVHDKERKNLCEYFRQKTAAADGAGEAASAVARRQLDDLFK